MKADLVHCSVSIELGECVLRISMWQTRRRVARMWYWLQHTQIMTLQSSFLGISHGPDYHPCKPTSIPASIVQDQRAGCMSLRLQMRCSTPGFFLLNMYAHHCKVTELVSNRKGKHNMYAHHCKVTELVSNRKWKHLQTKSHTVLLLTAPYVMDRGKSVVWQHKWVWFCRFQTMAWCSSVSYMSITTLLGEAKRAFHNKMQQTAQVGSLFGCHSCILPRLDFISYHVAW